jgi:hypothetical protein
MNTLYYRAHYTPAAIRSGDKRSQNGAMLRRPVIVLTFAA